MPESSLAGVARTRFIGRDIPQELIIPVPFFTDSDSLYLNGRLLIRGVEYRVGKNVRSVDLSNLEVDENDTLLITYHELPPWIPNTFGQPLPTPSVSGSPVAPPAPATGGQRRTSTGTMSLTGAKSFRFSARSAGASDFGQSLDLNITGELSPGLKITGAITDRGYDPAYGVANSRLNELDKVNIRLVSDHLDARLGDIRLKELPGRGRSRSVSGAAFDLTHRTYHLTGAAARPRGQFQSYSQAGQDGLQGPYQIGAGSRAAPVVPGSETVWLDGTRLDRGTTRDYSIDYSTGRITFNANHPIDSRSRMEIDYEPQTTEYKKEMFVLGGGMTHKDSLFFLSVIAFREGDDSEQRLLGEMSDSEQLLMQNAGDGEIVLSGAVSDTTGNYILFVDSLPDTVYQYAGEGSGDHAVTFSFVGHGEGEYLSLGNGQFSYVGPGRGDYLPVRLLVAPERTDEYQLLAGLQSGITGTTTAEIRTTTHDINLLSDLDDSDNTGILYDLRHRKHWRWNGGDNLFKAGRRVREENFISRNRINPADFNRDFLIPDQFVPSSDEVLSEISLTLTPLSGVSLSPTFKSLDYENRFNSRSTGVRAKTLPLKNLTLSSSWQATDATLDTVPTGVGEVDTYRAGLEYSSPSGLEIGARYERDTRRLGWDSTVSGVRYDRVTAEIGTGSENLVWERYVEDSLASDWSQVLDRNRISSGSSRKIGNLSYDLMLAFQELQRVTSDDNSFLARLNLRYHNSPRRLSITTGFAISEEQRNARGITYLEVEPGTGNYILEEGEYVSDPDGNFIRVDEILSGSDRVRRGEKSFQLTKDWSLALIRFNSRIEEELLKDGKRTGWWAVPFLTDDNQPFLFFKRRYDADIRAFPIKGMYVVNLTIYHDTEIRQIAGASRKRQDIRGELALKQKLRNTHLEETLELFQSDRDSYYSGAGDIDGFRLRAKVLQTVNSGELSAGTYYRRAESTTADLSEILGLTLGSRLRVSGRGELRGELELYRQSLTVGDGTSVYQLTDNRSGRQGAVWSVSLKYGLKESLRINFSISGRHSDDRTARILSRGEVVAGF